MDPVEETDGTGNSTDNHTSTDTLVRSLQDEIEYLRAEMRRRGETYAEESRRKDHIIAALTERIPELPPPASPQEATDGSEAASPRSDPGPERDRLSVRTAPAPPKLLLL